MISKPSGALKPTSLGELVAALAIAWRLAPSSVWDMPFAEALRMASAMVANDAAPDRHSLDALMRRFPDLPPNEPPYEIGSRSDAR